MRSMGIASELTVKMSGRKTSNKLNLSVTWASRLVVGEIICLERTVLGKAMPHFKGETRIDISKAAYVITLLWSIWPIQ